MKKIFSIRILLKCKVNSKIIFEEALLLVKLNNIDDMKEIINSYIANLDEENEDKIFELVSLLDYYEVTDEIDFTSPYLQIYSRFIGQEELDLYPEFS